MGNKRRRLSVLRDMITNIANIKAMTPEQLQAHLQNGRRNSRGTHRSKRAYTRKDKYGRTER